MEIVKAVLLGLIILAGVSLAIKLIGKVADLIVYMRNRSK